MKLGSAARIVKGQDWYISRYHAYLKHRDLAAEAQALSTIMDRPTRVRTYSWSASSAGGCLRARQFTYLGMPQVRPGDKAMNIFANGDYMHLRHQAFGTVAGYITDTEVSVALAKYNLLGTMDGVLSNGHGLELKSINTFGFGQVNTFGAKPEHVLQMHAYMLATDIEAFHAVYEDKNTQQLKEILVPRDEKVIGSVREELERLNESTSQRELIPMLPECLNGEGKYRWCEYASICENAKWPEGRARIA